jgi:hypothetical protein
VVPLAKEDAVRPEPCADKARIFDQNAVQSQDLVAGERMPARLHDGLPPPLKARGSPESSGCLQFQVSCIENRLRGSKTFPSLQRVSNGIQARQMVDFHLFLSKNVL